VKSEEKDEQFYTDYRYNGKEGYVSYHQSFTDLWGIGFLSPK
jgi:hypothetical protein